MTTSYTPTVKASAATLQSNSLGRKFQDPTKCDTPVFCKHFYYKNETGGTLADGTIIDFGPILGPGIILPSSDFSCTALGASRVLNLGLNSYNTYHNSTAVDGDIDTLASAVDVSSAVTEALFNVTSDANPAGLEIHGPVNLLGQVTGGTIPTNAIIAGRILISKPL